MKIQIVEIYITFINDDKQSIQMIKGKAGRMAISVAVRPAT